MTDQFPEETEKTTPETNLARLVENAVVGALERHLAVLLEPYRAAVFESEGRILEVLNRVGNRQTLIELVQASHTDRIAELERQVRELRRTGS